MLVELLVGPVLRAILDENLFLRVRATLARIAPVVALSDCAHEAVVHAVGERPAHLSLDHREAVLRENLLCMLKLLELHEGEVEVLEQGSREA